MRARGSAPPVRLRFASPARPPPSRWRHQNTLPWAHAFERSWFYIFDYEDKLAEHLDPRIAAVEHGTDGTWSLERHSGSMATTAWQTWEAPPAFSPLQLEHLRMVAATRGEGGGLKKYLEEMESSHPRSPGRSSTRSRDP